MNIRIVESNALYSYYFSDNTDTHPDLRYGLTRYRGMKRAADIPGNLETPTTYIEGVNNLGLPEHPSSLDVPWDMMLYNPMLRGKKSMDRGMNSRGFACIIKSKRYNHCPMSMILKDNKNNLQKNTLWPCSG